jgi:hypothetical protein
MSEELSTASLKRLVRFPFQDGKWASRFLIGSLLTLANYVIPIVPSIFVFGYILRVMRQTIAGEEPTLPTWDDWGRMFKEGLGAMVAGLVYFLPALLVLIGGMVLYFVGILYLPFTAGTSAQPEETLMLMPIFTFGSMGIMFLSMFLGTLFSLLGALVVPVALGHFVAQGELRAAFRVRQWWRILKADKLGYFVTWVVMAGLMGMVYIGFMLAYSTIVLCCLLPILMAPFGLYIMLVGSALFGQTYHQSQTLLHRNDQGHDLDPATEPVDEP